VPNNLKKLPILKADNTGKVADPFDDLDALRCDQTFERTGTAIKQITRVPVRKAKSSTGIA
jgi:hypothetical protein